MQQISKHVYAGDASHHMVSKAVHIVNNLSMRNATLYVCDMRANPIKYGSADIVIAGWSFCYLAVWDKNKWKAGLQKGLKEAERLLAPGGTLIILENFGIGTTSPYPPPHLNNYFSFLETSGFQSAWIRTDYRFKNLDEAVRLSYFFFGDELSNLVKENQWVKLSECTGIFWHVKSAF